MDKSSFEDKDKTENLTEEQQQNEIMQPAPEIKKQKGGSYISTERLQKARRVKKRRKKANPFARIIGLPFGALVGYWIYVLTNYLFEDLFNQLPPTWRAITTLGSIVFFALIFMLSAPSIWSSIAGMGLGIERKIGNASQKDLAAGTIGLIMGLIIAYILSDLVKLIPNEAVSTSIIILLYVVFSLVGMSVGTKKLSDIIIVDDKKARAKEARNISAIKILDTSSLIDGRILDLAKTGFIEGTFVIPNFVLQELQTLSDSNDSLKRVKGRRGLDIARSFQKNEDIKVIITEEDFFKQTDVDAKLLKLATKTNGKIVTCDYNLNKVASVLQIIVLNINELSNGLKKTVIPGEILTIELIKKGKDEKQGVGYLEDGTMVVVENGGDNIGSVVRVTVTTSLQTNAGRMIFAKIQN